MQIVRPEKDVRQMRVQIEVVPSYDLLISLAAAAEPGRYELPTSWARQVRLTLPSSTRRELTFFFGGPLSLGVGPIQFVPDVPGAEDPGVFLAALESLDEAELVVSLLHRRSEGRPLQMALRRAVRGTGSREDDERVLRAYAASLKAETRKRFWSILSDPGAARKRYLDLIRAYHDSCFASRYPGVLPVLTQRAKQARRSIGKLATKDAIARVTGGFTLRSPNARSITLVPSYYASPFVFVVREERDVVLVYGARPAQPEAGEGSIDPHTVRVLKALADETRLRILHLLARRPMYGQQLAEALGVSHPTISHHMAQLRIAGLTRTELAEDGTQTYSVRVEAVDDLYAELREVLAVDGER